MTRQISIAAAIAAATIGFATPALAEDPRPETRVAAGTVTYPVSEETRVCIVDTPTGSRVPRKVCDTLRNWKAMGTDPFAKR